jgi:thiamine pyrophosphate-dependent acetolactate synthase large subunit-like protein
LKVKAVNGLIKLLREEGTEWVCTFPTNIFINACGEEGMPLLMVRTERFAVAVADAYSRATNGKKIGVSAVMGGLNAAGTEMAYGALAQAYEDSSPLLCLTDGVPNEAVGRERFNIEDGFRSVTKWSGYINQGKRVPEYVRRAYTMLRSGHPSPVMLQVPRGLEDYDVDEHPYTPVKGWRPQGDPQDVQKTLHVLLHSKNPMIYAGQGIFFGDACVELRRFAELTGTPVLTTLMGKSCFPENHPLSLGVRDVPAERWLESSDLIIALGASLGTTSFGHEVPTKGKIIVQCTIDEIDLNRATRTDHAIVGDAKLVLRQLIAEAEKQDAKPRQCTEVEVALAKEEKMKKYRPLMEASDRPINPYRVYAEIINVLDPLNSTVTHESGNTRDQLTTVYDSVVEHGFMAWGNVSTLGFGLGAAMGAKLAYPKRQVVNVTGDAGVSYQISDYEALIRHGMGITMIHINNGGFSGYGPGFWGSGHTPYACEVSTSNTYQTAKAMEALGMHAVRVENPDEVASAIKEALSENSKGRPAFIEVLCCRYPVYGNWFKPPSH